jgi:5-methylcytosine-specific restriction endonuclease McrA
VKKGYCIQHKQYETTKFNNKNRKTHAWYNLPFWRGSKKILGLRKQKLLSDPLCQYCKDKGKLTEANTVDHVIDFLTGETEDQQWHLFSDFENLRSSCTSCHNAKTGRTNKFAYKKNNY